MNDMVIYFGVTAIFFVPLCLIVAAKKLDRHYRRHHLARLPVAPSAKWALKVNSKN